MTFLRRTTTWLLLLPALAFCRPAGAQYTVPPDANASYTTIWNVPAGSWTTAGNWIAGVGAPGSGGVPNVANQDFALVNNGGTASINSAVAPQAGGVILGELAANSGTLDIQSGGSVTLADQRPTFTADGSLQVGRAGTGTFFVRRGGSLNAASISLGGLVGSSMTLGGTTGSGNSVVALTGAATLDRTTRVIGPNVAFSAASISLTGNSVYIPELTGASHSVLTATGNIALGGSLRVAFNGASPTAGSSWNLFDAATISGSFASIAADPASPLGLGQVLGVRTVNGGNGKLGQLFIDQLPVLSVNRNTGAVAISNPGSVGIPLDSYTVQSTNGALVQANWQSLATHPAVAGAGWSEANPTANRLSELRSSMNSTLAGAATWGLGNIFQEPTPAQFGQNLEDIVFQYNDPVSQKTVNGIVNYTGGTGINNLVLFADPATGNVKIRNTSPFNVTIDGYTISSTAGSLNSNPALWTSLKDSLGNTWAEANLSDNRVSELQSSGTTMLSLNGGTTYDLGSLFKTASAKDLVFQFLLKDNSITNTGVVLYEAAPAVTGVLGDYNKNGVVDAADYTLWRNNVGQPAGALMNRNPLLSGPIGADDYAFWKSRFGATSGSGIGSLLSNASSVPEPSTFALTFMTTIAGGLVARRRVSLNSAV